MVLMRHMLGEVIRDYRIVRGMTLRDVAPTAGTSISYLSEIERGRKEPSSEMLEDVATAMGVNLSELVIEAGARLSSYERTPTIVIPDTIPDGLFVGR